MKEWSVDFTRIESWLGSLSDEQYLDVMVAVNYLRQVGPQGGRPFIDRLHHSRIHHLKELRPTDSAKYIRIIFAFDPVQQAILLVAGNKEGQWDKWYKKNIPLAEQIYIEHLKNLRERKDND